MRSMQYCRSSGVSGCCALLPAGGLSPANSGGSAQAADPPTGSIQAKLLVLMLRLLSSVQTHSLSARKLALAVSHTACSLAVAAACRSSSSLLTPARPAAVTCMHMAPAVPYLPELQVGCMLYKSCKTYV
jgi:hypothetical protein